MFMLLLSAALAAQTTAPEAPAATPTPTPTPVAAEKPVCRKEVPLGSIMAKRTCHSKAEWAAIDSANAGAAENARRINGGRTGAPR
ncbi:hypothetical protein [Sphingomonas abaci]|uniref:Uncharacterized protein n=1 Tax=Sphingomonas abaci TaxID=237611 RepID=A0A7W7ALK1_9SPHN|nr:hypothetical protein [Sphingomonas abaci]MBB4618252.1 hypothetical protein [Sphingomonas abaci]